MSSLTTLRAKLAQDYTKDPNNRIFNSDTVDRALNKWYEKLQFDTNLWIREVTENKTTTSVAWTIQYDLPDDCWRVKLVRYNGEDLIKIEKEELKRIYDTLDDQWTPVYYYLYWWLLGLYPIPDNTLTIDLEYSKLLSTISSSQDANTPSSMDDAICAYAAYKLFLPMKPNDALNFRATYDELLSSIMVSWVYDDTNIKFWYQRGHKGITREDVLP